MGLAPVAYVLWDRFLRYSPANPHWPNRDRVVLSAGHASMLLYSDAAPDRLRPSPLRDRALPPVGLEMPGASGIPHHARRGDDDGTAGTGSRELGGHGHCRALAGGPFQPGRGQDRRLPRLCDLLGRRHDGRDFARVRGAGRPSEALQPDLALRLQPRQPGRAHVALLQRRRGIALQGLPLERADRGGRQRPGGGGSGDPQGAGGDRTAHADHRAQPHRIRRAPQAGHERGPRRTAGRGGGKGRQALLWLAGGRTVPDSGRGWRAPGRSRGARQEAGSRVERKAGGLGEEESRAGQAVGLDDHRQTSRGMGQGCAGLPGRCQRALPPASRATR